jgi:hypothetical protein
MLKAAFDAAESVATDPEHLLELAIEGIAEDANRHHTRGCPFINATAEYADAQSLVRGVVSSHRRWFRGQLERYLDAAGRGDAGDRADELVMLRDAVLVGSYLDDRSAGIDRRMTHSRGADLRSTMQGCRAHGLPNSDPFSRSVRSSGP